MAWLSSPPVYWTLLTLGQIALVMVVLLLTVAYVIYAERKIFAAVQRRKGPNVVGPFGLLQSFADLGKFLVKELVIPAGADKTVFLLAPLIMVTIAFGAWAVIPFGPGWTVADINVGVLYLFAISSLGVYGVIMGGWASNSKYPFMGGLRSAAQMISYEVSIGFVIITVILMSGSLSLQTIVEKQGGWFWHWNVLGGGDWKSLPMALVMIPMMTVFFISSLAETNRPPFDLPEAESELVAGYQVEYGSTPYLLIYLSEMLNVILMATVVSVLFFGGWQAPFPTGWLTHGWPSVLVSLFGFAWLILKIFAFLFMFIMVRAIVPRYRYDQLMRLGWKIFLPTSIAAVVLIAGYHVLVLGS